MVPLGGPRLWVVLACEDDPRLCTGRRLVRLSMAREFGRRGQRPPSGAILLDPHASTPVGGADAEVARERGIVAVDCSWNRLGDRGGFPPDLAPRLRGLRPRRLPSLLAANPQHYGRLGELNTAEALGAAVFLTLGKEAAEAYFDRLPGRLGFLRLNEGPLRDYSTLSDPDQVAAVERSYFP